MYTRTIAPAVAAAFVLSLGCSDRTDSTATPKRTAAGSAKIQNAATSTLPKSDAERIADVHTIARLIEDFKQKTGHYPYEEAFLDPEPGFKAVPATVNITRQKLAEQYRYPPPGASGVVYPFNEFLAYLQDTLGGDVMLPSDSEPAPRFYQYQFDGQHYYVSATLLQPTSDTCQLAPQWHKYQVSSTSAPEKEILRFLDIK
jgi:hypothetical protein